MAKAKEMSNKIDRRQSANSALSAKRAVNAQENEPACVKSTTRLEDIYYAQQALNTRLQNVVERLDLVRDRLLGNSCKEGRDDSDSPVPYSLVSQITEEQATSGVLIEILEGLTSEVERL